MKLRFLQLLFVAPLITACAEQKPENQYDVDIRWTSYGVPHVLAEDWASLGYGMGYAWATDGVCVYAKELATANGTLAADFGPTEENLASDIFHRSTMTEERLAHHRAGMPAEALQYNEGFKDGYNRYLHDHEGRLPASCNGKKWVRPIGEGEMEKMMVAFGIRYGLGNFKDGIAAATPPGTGAGAEEVAMTEPPQIGIGSNAIAVGSSLTATGRGLLLGNPHYPWHGPSRFHMAHMTIPGVVDVMGAGLLGGNFIGIGFNKDIAWTHTVSTAQRFTVYELELNPDNPMQYRYDDGFRDIEPVTVEVPGEEGTTTHTVYMSHYGPVTSGRPLPWTAEKAYAIRDAIVDNNMAVISYFLLQTAENVAEVEAAISQQGIYFVNTIAADREGRAFYGDISATPNIDAELLEECRIAAQQNQIWPSLVFLDGSRSECEWKNDARSKVAGNMPADDMPRATSTDYFTNSNDSYWLANPARPLQGYSPIIGSEGTARNLRTRAGLTFVGEVIQEGRKFTPQDLKDILYSHRHFGAEVYLDEVLNKLCDPPEDRYAEVCEVLSNWDRTSNIDSVGTRVWTEFWDLAEDFPGLYGDSFDAADPVGTPDRLGLESDSVNRMLRDMLFTVQHNADEGGLPLDAKWGDVQFAERNGERIGIPGAIGSHGGFSYIVTGFTEGKGYTPILHGNSYIQIVGWDEDGSLNARGILTYSQSPESDSPHYSDQTKLYSRGEMINFPFTEEEIAADPNMRIVTLTE